MAWKDIRLKAGLAAVAVGFALIAWPAGALAAGGGVSADAPVPPSTTTGTATLLPTGLAVAPADAPQPVKRAIRFANQIVVGKPYRLGGGHRLPWALDTAYDCSGTVSWALRGARLLRAPQPSGSFRRWGVYGPGRWITVYANGGHMYAVIAGLRLDTSQTPGIGPGWSTKMRSPAGYTVRHAPGL